MGTVTIYFAGICTHLWQEDPASPHPHRTVLVNAREGHPDRDIQPHFPLLRVHPEDIISGEVPDLAGVTITVHDSDAKPDYSDEYRTCIPHLVRYTEEDVEINPQVTVGRDPARTAAHIDIHGGHWCAGVDKEGAAVAYVTIETDTENVALSIKPFDDELFPDLVIRNNAEIQIENIGRGTDDDQDHDFLLHFLIMSHIPADAWWPEEGDLTCKPLPRPLPWDEGTIGPGCSNSNYP
jgi:hypothetical protein